MVHVRADHPAMHKLVNIQRPAALNNEFSIGFASAPASAPIASHDDFASFLSLPASDFPKSSTFCSTLGGLRDDFGLKQSATPRQKMRQKMWALSPAMCARRVVANQPPTPPMHACAAAGSSPSDGLDSGIAERSHFGFAVAPLNNGQIDRRRVHSAGFMEGLEAFQGLVKTAL